MNENTKVYKLQVVKVMSDFELKHEWWGNTPEEKEGTLRFLEDRIA